MKYTQNPRILSGTIRSNLMHTKAHNSPLVIGSGIFLCTSCTINTLRVQSDTKKIIEINRLVTAKKKNKNKKYDGIEK